MESLHEMISMPPPINWLSRLRQGNAGLRRSRFLQTILRAGPSSSQQNGSHCRLHAALRFLTVRKRKYIRERRSSSGLFETRQELKTPVSFESSPLLIPQQGNRQLKASTQINLFTQKSVKLVRERINYLPNERINYLPQQVTKHDSRLSEHRLPR